MNPRRMSDLSNQATARQSPNADNFDQLKDKAGEEETSPLNAEIPASLHQEIKLLAVRKNTTMRRQIIDALQEHLNRND